MDQHEIPQTLDAPALALIFDATHLFSFIGFSIVGVAIGHPFIAGLLGITFGSVFNKYADSKPDGYLRHLLYFRGLPMLSGRTYLNGLDREFRP